ncbi:MAG: recombinase family protein [Clostridia bacterium]|nr:recombinase family protein [Clostridia bacterium]
MKHNKAIAYIRVVTEDRNVIDEQKRHIESAVFKNEYELVDSYIDVGDGASLKREGIKKLLEDAKNNRMNAVFVNSKDDLSTDRADMIELMEMFSALNVLVYSVDGKCFLNDPLDTLSNLSREIYNTLSEMEQNGIDLVSDVDIDKKASKKDPTAKLESKIIEAYLEIQGDNRPQV